MAFTRRVAEKAPLGSPQILICGESEHIRVFTVKTEFWRIYEDSEREKACTQGVFSSKIRESEAQKPSKVFIFVFFL